MVFTISTILKENGKKSKLSTHTKHKGEAYKFLANFEQEYKLRKQNKIIPIELKKFTFEFLKYSESNSQFKSY